MLKVHPLGCQRKLFRGRYLADATLLQNSLNVDVGKPLCAGEIAHTRSLVPGKPLALQKPGTRKPAAGTSGARQRKSCRQCRIGGAREAMCWQVPAKKARTRKENSFQHPLLTELNTVPAGKGKIFKELSSSFRTNSESRR